MTTPTLPGREAAPRLADRVVLVTGAGSVAPGWGIGKAAAVAYARAGAAVVAADIAPGAAYETAGLIAAEGGRAVAVRGDAGEDDDVRRMVAEGEAAFGRIDVVLNNVGLGRVGDALATGPDDWERAQRANVTALLLMAKAVLPGMIGRRRGVFLTTASVAGLRHVGFAHLAYSVTKAAAIHFTRMIAGDHARDGIRAVSLVPGLIDTPRIRQTVARAFPDLTFEELRGKRDAQVPLGHMGTAWDVAHAAVFLASDEARYITGTELVIDGGLSLRMGL